MLSIFVKVRQTGRALFRTFLAMMCAVLRQILRDTIFPANGTGIVIGGEKRRTLNLLRKAAVEVLAVFFIGRKEFTHLHKGLASMLITVPGVPEIGASVEFSMPAASWPLESEGR
jgi:hypothetical protein